MKLKKILSAILIVGLIGCQNKEKEVIINIKINGKYPEKVVYTTPIDGKWFYGDKKSIITDSIRTLQIKMDVEKPSFMTMYSSGKAAILLIEPGNAYDTEFEFESNQKKFNITSAHSIGQNFYNTLVPPEFYMMGLSEFYNDSIPEEISTKINSLREKEVFKFDELLKNNEISKDFHKLALLDREVYYNALEAGAAGILLQKHLKEKEASKIKGLKNFWSKKLKASNIIGVGYDRSPWFYTLANNYIRFAQLLSEDFDLEKLKKHYESGDIYQYNIDEAKKYLNEKELEYYLACYVFHESWQTKDNSKKVIGIYENFKDEYQQSPYNEYLEVAIEPIVTFHKNLENAQVNRKIQLVENYKEIDNFDDLIAKLNGKKVYVDIWGTWCGPCKKEFQQKDKYSELLKSKNITTLYICEGKHSKEKVWKEMIKSYGLEGQHILANQKLVSDIIDRFGSNGNFAYPRYLLVDEKGDVVNKQASYPSKIKQLEKEINKNYVW